MIIKRYPEDLIELSWKSSATCLRSKKENQVVLEKILQTVDFFNRVFFGSVWTGKNDLKTLRVDANGRKIAPFSKISGYVWTGT